MTALPVLLLLALLAPLRAVPLDGTTPATTTTTTTTSTSASAPSQTQAREEKNVSALTTTMPVTTMRTSPVGTETALPGFTQGDRTSTPDSSTEGNSTQTVAVETCGDWNLLLLIAIIAGSVVAFVIVIAVVYMVVRKMGRYSP
ncbi:podoplanin [Amia ocellicauda]|uniref:podoplanin n=1 Tax=Amia ocellicauda TaxID=2972642 RepID=UPI0034642E0D